MQNQNTIIKSENKVLFPLGQTVMISNFQEYFKVVEYFSSYTKARMGLALGVNNLIE